MYNNVGEKMKTISTIFAAIVMCLNGLLVIITLFDGGSYVLFLIGCFGMFLGWISGMGLYAFGQLITTQEKILKEQTKINKELRMMRLGQDENNKDYCDENIILPKL